MLYLLEDREYLKIGYAKDINQRFKQHQISNLHLKLLDTKIGTLRNERELHQLCKKYWVQSEWYQNCPEVINIWNYYNSKLEINDLKEVVFSRSKLIQKYLLDPKKFYITEKIPTIDEFNITLFNEMKTNNINLDEYEYWLVLYQNQTEIFNCLQMQKIKIKDCNYLNLEYFPNKTLRLCIIRLTETLYSCFGILDQQPVEIFVDIINQYTSEERKRLLEHYLTKQLFNKKESN